MGTYSKDVLLRQSVYICVHTGCIVCIGGHCTMFRARLTDLIDGILPGKNMSRDIM